MGTLAWSSVVDIVLAIVVLEAIALFAWHRLTGHGPRLVALAPNLLAGFCLLLALKAALAGAPTPWIGLALSGSLVAHLADLGQRWSERAGTRAPSDSASNVSRKGL